MASKLNHQSFPCLANPEKNFDLPKKANENHVLQQQETENNLDRVVPYKLLSESRVSANINLKKSEIKQYESDNSESNQNSK